MSEGKLRRPEQVADELQSLSGQLRKFVSDSAGEGKSFDPTERKVWEMVRKIGFEAMELFVSLQGDGDLGEQVTTEDGQQLVRSAKPATTIVRSIFGEHVFQQSTYSRGKNKTILLRPLSARMLLPENRWSYLLAEFSQIFSVESAFDQTAANLDTVLGGKFSVDTLEQTNQRMGVDAGEFLDDLPMPSPEKEGELLVASADCKGVPLVKKDAAKVAAFETAKKRPGNRRMATVTSVYSVDRYVRSAKSIVDALFREEPETPVDSEQAARRPEPKFKNTTAHFPTIEMDLDTEIRISGIHEGMAWLAGQVDPRQRDAQTLVVLMDGQESLWDVAAMHWGDDERTVEILDFLHVAVYVWEAAALFYDDRSEKEAFTRERLLKLLHGKAGPVIRGLRRMGTLRKLSGEKRKDLMRINGYLEKHQKRMQYDEYLREGYPIASGVIEGACRHLVKDRMERSGMRWTLEGARSMLNVRAAFQSDHWDAFQKQRVTRLSSEAHPHRNLVDDYQPLNLVQQFGIGLP
jgi:hypothetical protein